MRKKEKDKRTRGRRRRTFEEKRCRAAEYADNCACGRFGPATLGRTDTLRGFKERGYRVAVDDMGAGYSSLQSLAAIEPDFLKFDVTAWGWIHLIAGIVVLLAGFALFSGAVWARTVGVILALVSAIANFAWLPYYPVWSILIIAVDIAVIWALTVHGRDIAEG